jgi:hypothetical protein
VVDGRCGDGEGGHGGAVGEGEGRDDGDLCIDEDVHDAEVKLVVGIVGFTESGLRLYSVLLENTHRGSFGTTYHPLPRRNAELLLLPVNSRRAPDSGCYPVG